MDNFQDFFGSADNWNITDDAGREVLRGESASSVDSSTPPPQNFEDKEEKRHNSIRGKVIMNVLSSNEKQWSKIYKL